MKIVRYGDTCKSTRRKPNAGGALSTYVVVVYARHVQLGLETGKERARLAAHTQKEKSPTRKLLQLWIINLKGRARKIVEQERPRGLNCFYIYAPLVFEKGRTDSRVQWQDTTTTSGAPINGFTDACTPISVGASILSSLRKGTRYRRPYGKRWVSVQIQCHVLVTDAAFRIAS